MMNQTMEIKIGNYEVSYGLENEHSVYYITVEERENSEITKTGRFVTSIVDEEEAVNLLNLLCENKVGAVHMEDILCELDYGIE